MDKEILSEFSIPNTELNADMEVGDRGTLSIEVEVIGQIEGCTVFRKHNKVKAEVNFKPENAKQMRERLIEKQDKEDSEY
jgi:hypothetical protein